AEVMVACHTAPRKISGNRRQAVLQTTEERQQAGKLIERGRRNPSPWRRSSWTRHRRRGERRLGNEQEDIGFLLVGRVAVENQPARGKTEAFSGAKAQPYRRTVGGLSQKPSHQLSDRRPQWPARGPQGPGRA